MCTDGPASGLSHRGRWRVLLVLAAASVAAAAMAFGTVPHRPGRGW